MQISGIPLEKKRRAWIVLLSAAVLLMIGWRVCADVARLVFGGAVIAFLIVPLCALLEKKLSRPLAALTALLIVFGALAGLVVWMLPMLIRQISDLSARIPNVAAQLQIAGEGLLARLQFAFPGLSLQSSGANGLANAIGNLSRAVALRLSRAGEGAYRLAMMLVLAYFFAAERQKLCLRLELLLPASQRALCVRMGCALARELRLYIRGQATIALAVGALAVVGLMLIGLPGAPLLGALVGIFDVIPYLGPFLGGIPAVLAALGLGWKRALIAIGLLFAVQQIDGLVISPRVMGNVTGFSPAAVLLGLYAGARLGSISGMLLTIPALLTIRTVYRVFVQRFEND